MDKRQSQITDAILTAAPTLIFVVVSKSSSIGTALVLTLLLAITIVVFRMVRHESAVHAWIGCLIAALGGITAVVTGQARGYFLLSAILPAVITIVCLVSIVVRRPLAGLLLNRFTGGPRQWYRVTRLRKLYVKTTLVCAGVNVATAVLQAVFYSNSQTALLGFVHVVTGPIFALIMGFTIAGARRRTATGGEADHPSSSLGKEPS